MGDDTGIFKEPGFWAAVAVGLAPVLIGAAVLIWIQS